MPTNISIIVAMWGIPLLITGIQSSTSFIKCDNCTHTNLIQSFVDIITRFASNVIFTSIAIVLASLTLLQGKMFQTQSFSVDSILLVVVLCGVLTISCIILFAVKLHVRSKFWKIFVPLVILIISLSLAFFTVFEIFKTY